ncbi:MAG: ribonuclease P Rpr2/Rpp21/SNM1 subunit [Desulfurococcales archaeon]|nr:ribonuclease P Rpr2/Rpp21/SNM1 subunit [Desulfurococcales archaeon]
MRKRQYRRKILRIYRDLVRQRVHYLYKLAVEETEKGRLDYAASLGNYIKKLSKETGTRLPRDIKRSLCKNCGLPLIPGITSRVRLRTQGRFSYIVITCARCGWIHRYPYKAGRRNDGKHKRESQESIPF